MTDGQDAPNVFPTQYPGMALASPDVDIAGVDQKLVSYAATVAKVHAAMFGEPMVITSGKDGKHVPGSAHYAGRALDVRSRDLDAEESFLFGIVLSYFAPAFQVGVFDERGLLSAPHWHLEVGMFGS